ncbi:unnamed protein product [Ilex paraguariensis]|uniref:Uncharacterized protein n=1 Tax=Ilex paraguariensis TaxID=185542 RepID=A0ABC8RTB2_9AQUA
MRIVPLLNMLSLPSSKCYGMSMIGYLMKQEGFSTYANEKYGFLECNDHSMCSGSQASRFGDALHNAKESGFMCVLIRMGLL